VDILERANPAQAPTAPVVTELRPRPRIDGLDPIERAMRWLLAALDRMEVPAVVLRGDRDLPQIQRDGDLDLLCAPRHAARFEWMLERATERYGVTIVARHHAGHVRQYQLHGVSIAREHRDLCLDLHTAATCFGVPFLSAQRLLQGRTRRHGHARPDAVVSAIVDFLGPYVSGGAVRDEHLGRLATVWEQRPLQTRRLLGEIFGTGIADELGRALADPARPALFRAAQRARRALLSRAFARRPLSSARHLIGCVYANRIRPLFRPRGRVIAVLGTDGSGKTTLIDALRKNLAPAFRSAEGGVVKLRPGLFPQLEHVDHGPTTNGPADNAKEQRAAPPGTLGTIARAVWYTLDYVLGWPLRILPRRRRNALIVFERYVDDWLVDPERFRMRQGVRAVRWLASLAPRPDVTLICTASLRTIRARKRELDSRETLRQLEAYEALARSRPDVHLISTDGSLEVTLDRALSAIFPTPGLRPRSTRSRSTEARTTSSARRAA